MRPMLWLLLSLIAHGNGQDAADQAVLAEFFASHGYVVASVPSPMKKHPMTGESQIGAFAEEQARASERPPAISICSSIAARSCRRCSISTKSSTRS